MNSREEVVESPRVQCEPIHIDPDIQDRTEAFLVHWPLFVLELELGSGASPGLVKASALLTPCSVPPNIFGLDGLHDERHPCSRKPHKHGIHPGTGTKQRFKAQNRASVHIALELFIHKADRGEDFDESMGRPLLFFIPPSTEATGGMKQLSVYCLDPKPLSKKGGIPLIN